jgi:dTDP-4-dehydrorhamnose 3,5-epimerase
MEYRELEIAGLWLIYPQVYEDDRGYFMESFQEESFREHIGDVHFVQENESCSIKNVLRGLHYQRDGYAQAKLIKVVKGEVLDVAVDIRRDSPSYGQHVAVILSGENKVQFYIPGGFAHGFRVLSDEVVFQYKVDKPYAPEYESGIIYNDESLGINWGLSASNLPIISEKDRLLPTFI